MKTNALLMTVLALAAASAAADTRMQYNTPQGTSPEIAIKGDRIRMEDAGQQGRGITLFDAGSREMTVIDPSNRSYYRMDAESMKEQGRKMSEQMEQMRRQMEEQLENMPEEQREMMREQMEQMMPEQPEPADTGNIRFEHGGSASVAGIDCRVSTVYQDEQPIQRVCIAPTDNLGMSGSDRDTLRSLFTFLREMAVSFGGSHMGAQVPARMMEEFDGVPIRSEDLQGDQSWELRNVSSGSVDASKFDIPAGYSETDPFSMEQ